MGGRDCEQTRGDDRRSDGSNVVQQNGIGGEVIR